MEFKQPNRYNERTQLNVPVHGATPADNHRPSVTPPSPITNPSKITKQHSLVSKKRITVGVIVLVLIALIAGIAIHHHIVSSQASSKPIQKLSYATILPTGKTIKQLGGWVLVSPPGIDPVYAYNDSVSGVSVSVSEQPLPMSFKTNTSDQIAELSKGYNADDTVSAGSTQVYIGTSAKGPQSVIFTKDGLLILIKSANEISDTVWSSYVSSLN